MGDRQNKTEMKKEIVRETQRNRDSVLGREREREPERERKGQIEKKIVKERERRDVEI